MAKKNKISVSSVLVMLGILLIAVLLLSIGWASYYSKFKVVKTPQMIGYNFDSFTDSVKMQVEYQWIPVDSISRNAVIALLAAEDKNFYVHDGFSPINESDTISIIPNKHETITQKTAHSVFLTKGDSWTKNILEPYYTVLIEYLWGKDRILEVYMNVMPVGKGIFGIEAAAQIYFDKKSADLTKQEAAYIAALAESDEKMVSEEELISRQKEIMTEMGLMMHVKIGKKPVDEQDVQPVKPVYKRKWRG
ncbi:MAG: biosynthetic peptidoglycan transglycosylase [Dysgonomonas sp.]